MGWFRQKHDAITMLATAIVLTFATLAAVEGVVILIIYLLPLSILGVFGLIVAWFLWAWVMLGKGYLPSVSPQFASITVSTFGLVFWYLATEFADLSESGIPSLFALASLFLLFCIALFLPSRQTYE
ncbi:hypothetical protein SAMN05444000_1526 [Shimia gijangensis]|uniref:Uncharacterized protein n=1 Tax=Shimia gijangensis TaxID=1470563 RepID=A0A1M6U5A6_9RHOB|nr:hypothetical protein [Shimia gijangensis]SHK64321.1 hypothetical protein SAMN05444000_1526 [Shimia gijangensis]